MSDPLGPFKVILHSVDEMWNSRVRSEVAHLFGIDDDTASNIVSAIPIVVVDGLDARTAGIVRERMRPLAATGCRVITTDDPADTIPRVNWPETPEIARVPADEGSPSSGGGNGASHDHGTPISHFQCPSCGQALAITRPSKGAPQVGAQVGALAKPGTSAPSPSAKPGANGGAATVTTDAGALAVAPRNAVPPSTPQAAPRPETARSPLPATKPMPAPASASAGKSPSAVEPGPKLHGDDWLDPPLAKKDRPAASSAPVKSATPPPAAQPTPAPKPVAMSLLDDPLLAVKSPGFSDPSRATLPSDVTTLTAKPITNRFARGNTAPPMPAPQPQARPMATPTPIPSPAPASAHASASSTATRPTQRQPMPAPPTAGNSGRFPPSPPSAPARPTDRFAPPPPASMPPPPPRPAPATSSVADQHLDELDVHFDEASDLEAVEKLPRGKHHDDDNSRTPSGVDDEENVAGSGRHRREPQKDDLQFDEESSRSHRAPASLNTSDVAEAPSGRKGGKKSDELDLDDSRNGGRNDRGRDDSDIGDLLDDPVPARGAPKKGGPKLLDSGELDLDRSVGAGLDRSVGAGLDRSVGAGLDRSVGAGLDRPVGADASLDSDEVSSSTRRRQPALPPAKLMDESGDPDADLAPDDDELLVDDEPPSRIAKAKGRPAPAPAPAKGGGGGGVFDESEADFDDSDPLANLPKNAPAKKGKGAPREQDYEAALDLFHSDEKPLDDGRGLEPARGRNGSPSESRSDRGNGERSSHGRNGSPAESRSDRNNGRNGTPAESRSDKAANDRRAAPTVPVLRDDDDDLEIQQLDLASGGAKTPSGKRPAADPFDKRSSSAILEPLDPNEAMAILKEQSDPPAPPPRSGKGDKGRNAEPPRGRSPEPDDLDEEPPGPSGDLEPLDANEALAILGTDGDSPRGGKTPPKKPGRMKNGRRSDANKLVPLSASDEDFDFLDESKVPPKGGKGGKAGGNAKTDPFGRAASRSGGPNDETQHPPPGKKKTSQPFPQARGDSGDPDTDDDDGPVAKSAARKSSAGGGKSPAASSKGGGRSSGPVIDGDGDSGLVLSRITNESVRSKAAELIAEIKGISVDDALKLTDRTIIPVLKGVSRDVAEHHLEKFKRNKISGRVTTRAKDR